MYPGLQVLPGRHALPSYKRAGSGILKDTARALIESTGHEEISLSSLSSSDYSKLPELIDYLIEECSARKVNISLPSLRIDAFSLDVMSKVQDIKKSSLTFAPEAGSQRLRDVINKGLTEEVILEGAARAFQGGWTRVKLYFMLGLPTETEEDMKGIAHLAEEIAKNIMRYQKTSATADVRSWSALLSLCLSLLRLSSGQECSGKRITWIRQKW